MGMIAFLAKAKLQFEKFLITTGLIIHCMSGVNSRMRYYTNKGIFGSVSYDNNRNVARSFEQAATITENAYKGIFVERAADPYVRPLTQCANCLGKVGQSECAQSKLR